MLEIKNIKKSYNTGTFKQIALNNVSIKFRKSEFVSILGASGSGKTTLLNILGGLDKYDSGDLIINNKSTKKFKDKDWDAYRNNSIGFIFQSYNLIGHISVLENVELALKLNNISFKKRRTRAIEALNKVGLKDHINKKPNQLSGGQMQRVAIARSLVNNPDIILADEPTGALDSKTSIQIMELIKDIAKDKLVIMVTHNKNLAENYSSRIIELKDGSVISDSNEVKGNSDLKKSYKLKGTKMSFFEALLLSFNNILTKKGRTILTAFASSIGIIGIALILSLSNGFDKQIDKYEKGILSAMPVVIESDSINIDKETMEKLNNDNKKSYPNINYVIPSVNNIEKFVRKNKITDDYVDYIEKMPKEYSYGVSYTRGTNINFIGNKNNNPYLIDTLNTTITSLPKSFDDNSFINVYYDILSGRLPSAQNEMVLMVDSKNNVDENIIEALGLDKTKNIKFKDILNSSIRVVMNNDLYINNGMFYRVRDNLNEVYDKSYILNIVGIIRMKEEYPSMITSSSLLYTEDFMNYYIDINKNSNIVKSQELVDYNVLNGTKFDNSYDTNMTKDSILSYLGNKSIPKSIMLYPKDFDSKDNLLEYLNKYNKNKSDEDKIIYTDQAKLISTMSGSIMSAITVVLIAFSSISLIVSSIMIGIITYISVLERTKEIGILRALGARKKDVRRVFNAETFIIGLTSGLIGIGITLILIIPTNRIIYNLTDLENVAVLNPLHALILIIISLSLTLLGGFIPAKIASKKDPVVALRTE